ncbi:MAG: hypothetical protein M1831_007376 [Alyxoria varia]|nr:MAG: hypothetical protein M1831_007376 [Alyxoria varia]
MSFRFNIGVPLQPTSPTANSNTSTEKSTQIAPFLSTPANPTHRPISLQSPADLLHLRNVALKAARRRIDESLPVLGHEIKNGAEEQQRGRKGAPDAQPEKKRKSARTATVTATAAAATSGNGGDDTDKAKDAKEGHTDETSELQDTSNDELRRAVEKYLAHFIDTVFGGVRAGCEVNGLKGVDAVSWESAAATSPSPSTSQGGEADSEKTKKTAKGKGKGDGKGRGKNDDDSKPFVQGQEYEPYDTRLATRITRLHSKIEKLNLSLANTRREAVAAASRKFQHGYDDLDTVLAREYDDTVAGESVDSASVGQDLDSDVAIDATRQEEIARTFSSAVDTLAELVGSAATGSADNNTAGRDDDDKTTTRARTGRIAQTRGRAEDAVKVVEYLSGVGDRGDSDTDANAEAKSEDERKDEASSTGQKRKRGGTPTSRSVGR